MKPRKKRVTMAPEQWAEAVRLYLAGSRTTDLAAAYDVSRNCMSDGLKRHGLRLRSAGAASRAAAGGLRDRIEAFARIDGECRIWTGALRRSVPTVTYMQDDRKRVNVRPARVLFEERTGKRLRPWVHLKPACGSDHCIAPEHQRMVKLSSKGKPRIVSAAKVASARRRPTVKLSMEAAAEIRVADGTCAELAKRYGVSASLISLVRRGRYWREPSPFSGLGA